MTHPMERLLTTGADSQRRVDSKQAVMAYLVSVSREPAGGLCPSASYLFFCASSHKRPGMDQGGHGEVASVCDCSRLEPLPDEPRSFRFHQGPEAPSALV